MRGIRLAIGSIVAAGALTLGLVPPAFAHTEDQAIRNGCGENYRLAAEGTRNLVIGGALWGQVHLAYDRTSGFNCVVARKIAYHGVASRVSARLDVQYFDVYYATDPDAQHWESVVAYGAGRCVRYFGEVWNPQGTARATGGRIEWGNCGAKHVS